MEWWILGVVVVAGTAGILWARLRNGRRARAEPETKNIYPLW
jgi:hypothetical protein